MLRFKFFFSNWCILFLPPALVAQQCILDRYNLTYGCDFGSLILVCWIVSWVKISWSFHHNYRLTVCTAILYILMLFIRCLGSIYLLDRLNVLTIQIFLMMVNFDCQSPRRHTSEYVCEGISRKDWHQERGNLSQNRHLGTGSSEFWGAGSVPEEARLRWLSPSSTDIRFQLLWPSNLFSTVVTLQGASGLSTLAWDCWDIQALEWEATVLNLWSLQAAIVRLPSPYSVSHSNKSPHKIYSHFIGCVPSEPHLIESSLYFLKLLSILNSHSFTLFMLIKTQNYP